MHTPVDLLFIEASPMGEASTSRAVAQAFLDAYRGANPAHSVDALNVWDTELPPFDARMIAAKFAVLRKHEATPEQQALWESACAMSRRFNRARRYLFALPMWNFGLPYRLKHFIDVVTLPGENWQWSRETGYVPLLADKKAMLVYCSAGDYPAAGPADPSDHQKPQMRRWLQFIGVDEVQELFVGPTLVPPAALQATREAAIRRAAELGAEF
ncbi:MAG: NAD(P)H-dependent oxidoreductase [Pseudomonadota bacterium]